MKSNFLNARELHLYRSSGHELGTIRKLRFSAFQRHRNYDRGRRIIAIREWSKYRKFVKKSEYFVFLIFHLPVSSFTGSMGTEFFKKIVVFHNYEGATNLVYTAPIEVILVSLQS